jgi:hypothetical protein
MIALCSDYLLFELENGESIPCSADMISVEIAGNAEGLLDADMFRHAAASVFHYFKAELNRETVTVGEFSLALEKALQHLGLTIRSCTHAPAPPGVVAADLRRLAKETDSNLELLFFPRLRRELRSQLETSPRLLHFRGLRGCVKQLAGARRWSGRCEKIQEQIVEYLRQCLTAESKAPECSLVVE